MLRFAFRGDEALSRWREESTDTREQDAKSMVTREETAGSQRKLHNDWSLIIRSPPNMGVFIKEHELGGQWRQRFGWEARRAT
jgi:hypothetical protein